MFDSLKAELREMRRQAIDAWRERALAAERELQLAHQREAELTAQIRMVMEERFYRPLVTGVREPEPAAPSGPVLPIESLGDTVFPDEAQIQEEFDALVAEQEAWQAEHRQPEGVEAHAAE